MTVGLGDLSESVKNKKFLTKIFFSDNIQLSSKTLWKMMPADVKANIKQQGIKDLVTYLRNFYKKYLQNLRYNAKTGM